MNHIIDYSWAGAGPKLYLSHCLLFTARKERRKGFRVRDRSVQSLSLVREMPASLRMEVAVVGPAASIRNANIQVSQLLRPASQLHGIISHWTESLKKV